MSSILLIPACKYSGLLVAGGSWGRSRNETTNQKVESNPIKFQTICLLHLSVMHPVCQCRGTPITLFASHGVIKLHDWVIQECWKQCQDPFDRLAGDYPGCVGIPAPDLSLSLKACRHLPFNLNLQTPSLLLCHLSLHKRSLFPGHLS